MVTLLFPAAPLNPAAIIVMAHGQKNKESKILKKKNIFWLAAVICIAASILLFGSL